MYQPDRAPITAPKPSDCTSSITARFSRSPIELPPDVVAVPVSIAVELDAAGLASAEAPAAAEAVGTGVTVAAGEVVARTLGLADAPADATPEAAAEGLPAGVGEATAMVPLVFEKLPTLMPTTMTRVMVAMKDAIRPASQVDRGARRRHEVKRFRRAPGNGAGRHAANAPQTQEQSRHQDTHPEFFMSRG